MKNGRLIQNIQPAHCFPSTIAAAYEDFFNGNPAGDVLSMEVYERITFVILTAAGALGTAVATVESCDDVTPTTATAIPFVYQTGSNVDVKAAMATATAAGVTVAAGINTFVVIEVSASELSGTDKYVRLQLTEGVDSPVDGAAFAFLSSPRYGVETPPTNVA